MPLRCSFQKIIAYLQQSGNKRGQKKFISLLEVKVIRQRIEFWFVTTVDENVDNYFAQYASRYYLWDVNVMIEKIFVSADQIFLDLMASYSDALTQHRLYLGNENTSNKISILDDSNNRR